MTTQEDMTNIRYAQQSKMYQKIAGDTEEYRAYVKTFAKQIKKGMRLIEQDNGTVK